MKPLLGRSKVTDALPLLEMVAGKHNLKLNRISDFKMARQIIESTYTITKIK